MTDRKRVNFVTAFVTASALFRAVAGKNVGGIARITWSELLDQSPTRAEVPARNCILYLSVTGYPRVFNDPHRSVTLVLRNSIALLTRHFHPELSSVRLPEQHFNTVMSP